MASKLEDTTEKAKKISVGCIVAVIVIALGSLLIKLLQPPAERPELYPSIAQAKFGSMEKPPIMPISLASGSNPQYYLDISKIQYQYLKVLNVYKTRSPRQSLTAQEDATSIANTLGFQTNPLLVTEMLLRWEEGARTLEIDKFNWTIKVTSNYLSNEILQDERVYSADTNTYISFASNVLSSIGIEVFSTAKASYMRIEKDGSLVLSQSPAEADFVRVDFFDIQEAVPLNLPTDLTDEDIKLYEKYRINGDVITNTPDTGLIYVIVGDKGDTKNVFEMQVTNWEIADKSTYQIINPNTAWEEVEKGNGTLVSLLKTEADKFKPYVPLDVKSFYINSITIGFLNSVEFTPYLQPLFVFKGKALLADNATEADFIIYYPALEYKSE